jgi:hypothetical protein
VEKLATLAGPAKARQIRWSQSAIARPTSSGLSSCTKWRPSRTTWCWLGKLRAKFFIRPEEMNTPGSTSIKSFGNGVVLSHAEYAAIRSWTSAGLPDHGTSRAHSQCQPAIVASLQERRYSAISSADRARCVMAGKNFSMSMFSSRTRASAADENTTFTIGWNLSGISSRVIGANNVSK